MIYVTGCTITLTGTPAFSGAFAGADEVGEVSIFSVTYSGSATGARYAASTNGLVFTNGGGLPGTPGTGTTASGGQFV